MKKYTIRFSEEAISDIEQIHDYIAYILLEPATAIKYRDGILDAIYHLITHGSAIAISCNKYIQEQYGAETRTVTYKKMTIIYNIIADVIFIRRILPGSIIK